MLKKNRIKIVIIFAGLIILSIGGWLVIDFVIGVNKRRQDADLINRAYQLRYAENEAKSKFGKFLTFQELLENRFISYEWEKRQFNNYEFRIFLIGNEKYRLEVVSIVDESLKKFSMNEKGEFTFDK